MALNKNGTRLALRSAPLSAVLSSRVKWAVLLLAFVAAATVWATNVLLTERFTETTRQRAQLRLALYSGNMLSELRRNAIVPQLLARDPTLIGALNSGDYKSTSQRLLSYAEEIDAAGLMLLDRGGRIVASTDRDRLSENLRNTQAYLSAVRSGTTTFTLDDSSGVGFDFQYSRAIKFDGNLAGVVIVQVDLHKFQRSWAGISDAVVVTDGQQRIILSTESSWLGLTEDTALERRSAPSAIERAIRATADWTALPADAYVQGRAVMRQAVRVPFQGWDIVSFSTYGGVRQRVNTVIALEIMGFAMLLALAFYLLSRRTLFRLSATQQESEELRRLNRRLQDEISERERMEQSLMVAEQSLEQSSKLAALGEMSAAVSHELNQPLAAMKTYLAGAKLLLQRRRPDEAMSSFQRIDDLIGRMGAITRQLKSYARKGQEEWTPLDLRDALNSALEMMEPQLKARQVRIIRDIPQDPVIILGDRLRVEQVMINLFRNALDAMQGLEKPEMRLFLSDGDLVRFAVRDNGPGIKDLDALFEPFYTTKTPGEGIGLGLAISSGIVNDLGGRLTARNGDMGGAVFEMTLPRHDIDHSSQTAAE